MKYIVEFEDEPSMYEDEVHFYKCIQAPWWGLSERVIKQLTPYQPDIAPDTNVGNITNSCAHEKDHNADIGKKVEGDCISRQAVVKFFNDWISCLDENCHHQSVADMIIIKNDFKNLPSVQPESKWIPVSERLPDEGQKCLVSDKGAIGIDTYIGHGNPYNWKWYTRDYEAWMSLPAPYTEEKKE